MGAASSGGGQALLQALSIGPEDIPAPLRPLLTVGLGKVSTLYHQLGGCDDVS
eukprot:CAMPEP_0197693908 /NCGR_PEP_ID=MMETSP1338-20131121/113148_1 /TAXON_ID=43686 ORGANISM="Pelagodinium beii, Strain RCC1491" /NCGR_SAMPLE_ID=MMETSP1338 /ASSEMBLY_ACC=CAM_ASM_000754 /LENGTH=52 /DNA_ID=CAMNT_0043276699 /DNA_START=37 /DNA_END=192 /DNA_ORIENTATION=+